MGTFSGNFFDVHSMPKSGKASSGQKARHAKEAASSKPAPPEPPEPPAPCRGIEFTDGVVHLTDLRTADGQCRFLRFTVSGEHVSHGVSAEWLASPWLTKQARR